MRRPRPALRSHTGCMLLGTALACSGSSAGHRDAGSRDGSALAPDGAGSGDAGRPLLWVDFAIGGCAGPSLPAGAEVDAGTDPAACTAFAPAHLRFSAIAPARIEVYRWSFGDGSPENPQATPEHEFSLPGAYDVSLVVAGPGGTASVLKTGVIHIDAAPLGAACALGAQCQSGLCMCGPGKACPPGLGRGICTIPCGPGTCAEGRCADLAPSAPASPAEWQRALCLPACDDQHPCPLGLTCRSLRAAGGGWLRACFVPGVLGDLGSRCRDARGQLDHAVCSSGLCLDLGAYGMCGASCAGSSSCPAHSSCAAFTTPQAGLSQLCLADCASTGHCTLDPWLGCEAPGGPGARGFTLASPPPSPGTYCAPRACTTVAQCRGVGSCQNGFCGPL